MTTTATGVPDTVHRELVLARRDLDQARAAQFAKDTPAARARVRECRDRLDAILDTWNDSWHIAARAAS